MGTTTRPGSPQGRHILFPEDVAAIWTQERRRDNPGAPEVPASTVWSYLSKSRPAAPGREAGPYAKNPVPEPKARRGRRQPAWEASQEQALRDWWHSRPGRGVGGGRKPKEKT